MRRRHKMWKDEKTAYLRKNRDYSRLLDVDDGSAQTTQSQSRGRNKDTKFKDEDDEVSQERQEYLDRRRRLKELERQKLTKGKNGQHVNGIREKEELKVGNHNRGHGGSNNKGDAALPLSMDKKKLPYDRSFGSFFGPSEPVVAKRIMEEARAREEAEIVAARDANASRKEKIPERKKSLASSSAGKSSHDNSQTKKPSKPVNHVKMVVNERARQLKEARDYSFLFDDSALPEPKMAEEKGPASSKAGGGGRKNLASVRDTTIPTFRAPPSGQSKGMLRDSKSTLGARNPDRSSSSLLQSQSKSSQPSRPFPNQAIHDQYSTVKSAIQNRSKVTSLAKPLSNKLSSTGPSQPGPRKDTEAMMRKLVSEATTSNGNKNSKKGRQPLSSPPMERKTSQTVDRRVSQPNGKPPVQPADRRSTLGADRGLAQSTDRRPAQATGRRPAQSTERQPGQSTGAQPAQFADRRPGASQALQRQHAVIAARKTSVGANYKPSAGGTEPKRQVLASQAGRQNLQPKPALKGASRPAPSAHNRARYSDDPPRDEIRRKRARSLSEESDDEEPAPKRVSRPVPSGLNRPRYTKDSRQGEIRRARARSLSDKSGEDEASDADDSFIDDDDNAQYHPSMIHRLMGYDPNKYRGNDDFDDRSMEVGFRTIQAEERRSAREARLEDERELALIEAEEKAERLRKANKKKGKKPNR